MLKAHTIYELHNISQHAYTHRIHARIERQTIPNIEAYVYVSFLLDKTWNSLTRSHPYNHRSMENSCIYWMRNEDTKPTANNQHTDNRTISFQLNTNRLNMKSCRQSIFLFFLCFIICSFYVHHTTVECWISSDTAIYTYTFSNCAIWESDVRYYAARAAIKSKTQTHTLRHIHMTHQSFDSYCDCVCALGIEYWYLVQYTYYIYTPNGCQ